MEEGAGKRCSECGLDGRALRQTRKTEEAVDDGTARTTVFSGGPHHCRVATSVLCNCCFNCRAAASDVYKRQAEIILVVTV